MVEKLKGISLVLCAEFLTSDIKWLPGLLVTGPCGCTTKLFIIVPAEKYLLKSVRPSIRGDNSPAVKLGTLNNAFAIL